MIQQHHKNLAAQLVTSAELTGIYTCTCSLNYQNLKIGATCIFLNILNSLTVCFLSASSAYIKKMYIHCTKPTSLAEPE